MDPADVEKRILCIESIASLNGINFNVQKYVREKSLHHHLSDHRSVSPSDSNRKKWLRLPHLGPFSGRLAKELRRFDYYLGFYPALTIQSLSPKRSDPPQDLGSTDFLAMRARPNT